jgi:hypothetical protein
MLHRTFGLALLALRPVSVIVDTHKGKRMERRYQVFVSSTFIASGWGR